MIREAIKADAKHIAAIYNDHVENSNVVLDERPLSPEEIATQVQNIQDQGHHWLIAKENNRVVGYAYSCDWKSSSAYRRTAEVSLCLTRDAHSADVDVKLYRALFKALQEKEIHIALACINLPNDESVKLHEKFRMKKVAHFVEVGFKNEQFVDVGYWEVRLNNPMLNKIL